MMTELLRSLQTTPLNLLPALRRCVFGATLAGITTLSYGGLPAATAHFPLDEKSGTLVDNLASGPDGTLKNAEPATSWIAGKRGGALHLEGKKSHVSIPSNPAVNFNTDAFSISFWIRWTDANKGGHQHFINKGDYKSTNPGETGKRWEITTVRDTGVSFIVDDDVQKSALVVPYAAFTTGEWVHVVAVRDTANKQLRLYANGVPQTSLDLNDPYSDGVDRTKESISNAKDLRLGISGYLDNPFKGDLDDVRFFRRALTKKQIAELAAKH